MQRAGRPNGAKQEKRRSVSIFTQSRPSLPLFCSNNNRLLTFFLQKIVLRPKGRGGTYFANICKILFKEGSSFGISSSSRLCISDDISDRRWGG